MHLSGFVLNNTATVRHIFKRNVYPGHQVPLDVVFGLLQSKVPRGTSFLDWLSDYLPDGWEIILEEESAFEAPLEVHQNPNADMSFGGFEDNSGYHELPVLTQEDVQFPDKELSELDPNSLTAKDIFNLQVKDNPKKIIEQIDSIHKLRRALTMCKQDTRKKMLMRHLRARIKVLVQQASSDG